MKKKIIKGYRLGYPKTHRIKNILYLAPNKIEALRWGQYWKLWNEERKTVPLYYMEVKGKDVTKTRRVDILAPKEIIVADFQILKIKKIKEVSINDCRKVYGRKAPAAFLVHNGRVHAGRLIKINVEDKNEFVFKWDEKWDKAEAVLETPKHENIETYYCTEFLWRQYKSGMSFEKLISLCRKREEFIRHGKKLPYNLV